MRIAVPSPWMRYIFAKGYIAINGASLTVAEADRRAGWFEVWLIPRPLRMTTFGGKQPGDALHIEIDRQTQVFVDTVRDAIDERLGPSAAAPWKPCSTAKACPWTRWPSRPKPLSPAR